MIDAYDNASREDPARNIKEAPPNFGREVVPQVYTFQGLVSSISKTYKNPDEAIKHNLDNARYMRNDVGLMECLESRQRATALLDWHVEVDGPDMPAHKALADKLTGIIKQIPRFTEYRRCLLEAIWYGRHAVQHQFGWKIKPDCREVVVKEWQPINGDKLAFRYDDGSEDHPRNEIGIRVGAGYFKDTDLIRGRKIVPCIDGGMATFLAPYERALITVHKHMVEDAAFEDPLGAGSIHGIGIRSRIYWEWFQKQEILALFVEYLERSALGFEIWYYDASNPQSFADTKTAAENRNGRKNIVLVPRFIGEDQAAPFERFEPGASGADFFQNWLDKYHGHRIKRYILGQTLTSEADATGLGSGLAELHLQTMLDIVKYDANNLDETVTRQTLEQAKIVNCPEAHGVDCRFVSQTQSPDTESKLKAFESAWTMGARIKESDVMDAIGASLAEPGEPFLQNPQGGRQDGAPTAPAGNSTSVSMAGLGDRFKQALNVDGHGDALEHVKAHLDQHGGDEHATQLRTSMGFASKVGKGFGDFGGVERNRRYSPAWIYGNPPAPEESKPVPSRARKARYASRNWFSIADSLAKRPLK